MAAKKKNSAATRCVQEWPDPLDSGSHILPLYASSSFVFDNLDQGISRFSGEESGYVYSRYGNPTADAVAGKIAALEAHGMAQTATCLLVSSGMAAISATLLSLVPSGGTILTQEDLYGGTTDLFRQVFPRLGITILTADLNNGSAVEAILAGKEPIRAIYLESPTNPLLHCVDLEKLASLARKYGIPTVVDNTLCTPLLQQPLSWGIDLVIHSTTKFLNGHGNAISGCIVGKDATLMEEVSRSVRLMGCSANPWDSWLLHNGLKTLALRMAAHGANALALAHFLKKQPGVSAVYYPGLVQHETHPIASKQMKSFGGMLSFELSGGIQAARGFLDKIQIGTLAPTLGDVNTLLMHPSSMSHRNLPQETRNRLGISDGLIRVSVGIESQEDLLADFGEALGN